MLTLAVVLAVLALLIAVPVAVCALVASRRPDPVDAAYNTLPAGRPELVVDTATGSHDRYEQMTDNTRDIVTAYCEAMWRHSVNGDAK